MLAVSVGIGSRSQYIKYEADKKQYSECYEAVDVECIDFKLPVYIYTWHLRLCLAWSRDVTANVSHDHCVASLGIQEQP